MSGSPCLSVVMPCYNEAATVLDVVKQVLESPYTQELLIVDDGSTAAAREILAGIDDAASRPAPGPQPGQGAALRRGFTEAQAPYVIVQDADLEYDPQDYVEVLARCSTGADVVFGLALPRRPPPPRPLLLALGRQPPAHHRVEHVHQPEPHRHGDVLRACRREVIQSILIEEDRFGF
jgi:glycosyltransferase involved in cell wall biosynthesis